MTKNHKNVIYYIISAFFILYGIGLFVFSGFHFGNLMVFTIGLCFAFFRVSNVKFPENKFIKIIKCLIVAGFIITAGLIIFTFFSFGVPSSNKNEDAVIVLGCGLLGDEVSPTLEKRLDACLEYYTENKNAVIIVSGGQGPTEDVTEAYAMEKYLLDKGIPKEKIIQEPNSSSTYENFVNSKEILDEMFEENYTTAFITNRFHCYRSYNLAKNAGINVSAFRADDEITSAVPSYLREAMAVIKLWVLGI